MYDKYCIREKWGYLIMGINVRFLALALLLSIIFVSCTANNGSSGNSNTENPLPDKNEENNEQDTSTTEAPCCEEKGYIIFDTSEDFLEFFERLQTFEGNEYQYNYKNVQIVLSKHVVYKLLELKSKVKIPFTTKEITEKEQFMRVGVSWDCSNNDYNIMSGLCEFYRLVCIFRTFVEFTNDIESMESLQKTIEDISSDPDSLKLNLGDREVYLEEKEPGTYVGYVMLDGYYSQIVVSQWSFEALSAKEYSWYSINKQLDFEYDKNWLLAD
jgi:hypothetical protein